MAQYEGVVRWFNNAKGYGFLGRDGGPYVFVHFSSIQSDGDKSLKKGKAVQYDVVQGEKVPRLITSSGSMIHPSLMSRGEAYGLPRAAFRGRRNSICGSGTAPF